MLKKFIFHVIDYLICGIAGALIGVPVWLLLAWLTTFGQATVMIIALTLIFLGYTITGIIINMSRMNSQRVDCLRTDCHMHDWGCSGYTCTLRRVIIDRDGKCTGYIPRKESADNTQETK